MNGQLQISEIQPTTQISISDTEPVDVASIHGVENELLVLQKLLGKPPGGDGHGFRAIGIIGVRGIGKSTVCRALLENPQVKSEYLPRIWVSMSKNFTEDTDPKIALLKRILISLGVDKDFPAAGQTLGGLLYAVRLQLRGKRYLIVLDDVQEFKTEQEQSWYRDLNCSSSSEKIEYKKLRDGFPKGNGGAVIVTSRSEKAAKSMVGEDNLRCLVAQKDPESFWKIFWQEVVKDEHFSHEPSNLEEMKLELLKKCGGLPLAAKMMGEIKFKERS